jgi:hypothetical protein
VPDAESAAEAKEALAKMHAAAAKRKEDAAAKKLQSFM